MKSAPPKSRSQVRSIGASEQFPDKFASIISGAKSVHLKRFVRRDQACAIGGAKGRRINDFAASFELSWPSDSPSESDKTPVF